MDAPRLWPVGDRRLRAPVAGRRRSPQRNGGSQLRGGGLDREEVSAAPEVVDPIGSSAAGALTDRGLLRDVDLEIRHGESQHPVGVHVGLNVDQLVVEVEGQLKADAVVTVVAAYLVRDGYGSEE